MNDDPHKIVSLAERRREDEARRKAEVAAQARAQKQARSQSRPAGSGPAASRLGSAVGRVAAAVVWITLLGAVALLLWSRLG